MQASSPRKNQSFLFTYIFAYVYSNLDSSKIKSKSFTTTVDQYSQVGVTVSGTIIAAISARYLVIVQEDNHTLRLFGSIAQYQLNRVNQGTTVNVTVFYF